MVNRPLYLDDYTGQERMKKQLRITMGACSRVGKPLPHMLISGPPGLGKTTIAKIISNETDVHFYEVMAGNLNTIDDLEMVFSKLATDRPDILFIDEIHRLPIRLEETLYQIMEDFTVSVEVKEEGTGNRSIEKFWIPSFTLIGATTLAGDLSQPLRDRFGIHFQLEKYSDDEAGIIIQKLAKRENTNITDEAVQNIAKRSKGTARIAINYYNRCKEYAQFLGDGEITDNIVNEQFELLGIDKIGLDQNDYKVLEYLATQHSPVGLDTLALSIGVDRNTVSTVIEPYLLQKRLIDRTRTGRKITGIGIDWIYSQLKDDTEHPHKNVDSNKQQVELRRFGGR